MTGTVSLQPDCPDTSNLIVTTPEPLAFREGHPEPHHQLPKLMTHVAALKQTFIING